MPRDFMRDYPGDTGRDYPAPAKFDVVPAWRPERSPGQMIDNAVRQLSAALRCLTVAQADMMRVDHSIPEERRLEWMRAELAQGATFQPSMEMVGQPFFPRMAGKPMDFIPAIVFGPSSLDCSIIERPPLGEMVEISQSHLNNSALREWAMMWCGQPVPVITGLPASDETSEIRLGSSQGLVLGEGLPDPRVLGVGLRA
jgi:hypothetical protein